MIDIYIIGLGVQIPGHITSGATRAMSRCCELYTIVQEDAGLWLPLEKRNEIAVTNLLDFYVEGRLRADNYQLVAKMIMAAARPGKSVGYVTYGNPMIYDRVAQDLVKHATEAQLAVRVIPGISSLDTLLCDLRVDMAPALQIFDASWFWACQMEPLLNVPALLMQVGAFGSLRTHYSRRQDGSSLKELVEYLSRFYALSHAVALVRSTSEEEQPAQVCGIALEQLCVVTAEQLSGASLYIPASENVPAQERLITRMEQN